MMNSLPRQNKGQDLVMFLIINQKSSNKIQAAAILTAMIEAGFLFALTNYDLEKGIRSLKQNKTEKKSKNN